MTYKIYFAFCFFLWCGFVKAQEVEPTKTYTTSRILGAVPVVDGIMNDEAWNQVEWGGDFKGSRPEYNVAPSQPTQFKILYDDKFLYVGIRAFDDEPEKIVKRMSRRDGFDGDWVEINIDSYYDKRTAFSFTGSVSGVKGDEYVTNNGDNWDATWDPIWYLKTSVDDKGWLAEFKIPLSQLRFADKPEHTWGIQLSRRFFRNSEISTWQPVSPKFPGWVHLFGELKGIKGIKPQKQLEIQPYVVGQIDRFTKEEDDPYRDTGINLNGNIGIDAKIGVTSNVTLDLSINPDFGQVEADPSVVNLTAFEQFFREQRPFFLEGNNLFSFQTSGGRNNLFYSRRIGAPAHGSVLAEDVAYTDRIPNTRILSAAKLTGKNAKGFSWGILSSVTGQVRVNVTDTLGQERQEKIEPYSVYTTARVQQDIKDGQTVVGALFTNMNRMGNDGNELDFLHDNAQSAGIDLTHNVLNRRYGFTVQFSGSRVVGSEESLTNTQESFVRLYQRPDNDYRSLDTTRTSLTGTSGRFQFGKKSGNWIWEVGVNHRSPGLDLNDIGFLVNSDNINAWGFTRYRILEVRKIFRQQFYQFRVEQNFDFGGTRTFGAYGPEVDFQFKNFWMLNTSLWYQPVQISNADLRGGPSIRNPKELQWSFRLRTNDQKKIAGYVRPSITWGEDDASKRLDLRFGVVVRPTDALLVSLDPRVVVSRNDLQYVSTLDIEGDPLYLLGSVNTRTYRMSMRVNYNVTPNLTLEFWGQPFLAIGEYDEFKEVTDSRHENFENRFTRFNNRVRIPDQSQVDQFVSISSDFDSPDDFAESTYGVFKTNNTAMDTYFENPDFNVINFRSNFVARWEYTPGSTLFFVWSSNGVFDDVLEDNSFRGLSSQLWDLENRNTFLIKYTYRFIL